MHLRRTVVAALAAALLVPGSVAAARPAPPPAASMAFSGFDWTIKSSNGKTGPGPNLFDPANAFVDAAGLHLRISRKGSRWACAEVINQRSLGYGTYSWTIASAVDALDPNVVLGLFTWNDDPAYAHREIDVEFAQWGNAADPTNGQYVVQPFDAAGHLRRITQPTGETGTTHSFRWEPGRVTFESRRADATLIDAWTYAGADVPVPGGENARMNLWLYRGAAPTDGRPVEVVISGFRFTPLPTPVS